MLTKSELKRLWQETGFRPIKRLGQNFLIDKNVKDNIVRSLAIGEHDIVVEIGPGFGELTFDIAALAKKVFAIEKDKRITEIFKDSLNPPKNITLINEDFLEADLKSISDGKKIIVYGNLPYYITSPILEKLISNEAIIKRVYLVVQKEVGNRILALPGSREVGRLSLFVQYHADTKRVFNIGKNSFFPVPEVESVFLRLDIPEKRKVSVKNEKNFFEIIKKAYGQRRKTLVNSLSSSAGDKRKLSDMLEKAGIDPMARPETLALEDFARLSNIMVGRINISKREDRFPEPPSCR